jgi:hypothetical protein
LPFFSKTIKAGLGSTVAAATRKCCCIYLLNTISLSNSFTPA